ncbi:FHA domain-containing protein [Lyngbya confervoides]|uniref:FHA domain-containing protein n=1 Tax=Lyngbya confervoides BDU141951 TaxID=1574623 RepID=A0ABD4T8E9_9CYAN|nr:FHA domain-containing protein [Lyngbya confervoides]MCM1984590.1 FHA domain-containing protein [Lyngbya confervoides BDU141951]
MTIPTKIWLSWQDPMTGETRTPHLSPPVALGREFNKMPQDYQGQRVSRLVLSSSQVSRYHAIIAVEKGQLQIIDHNSSNGLFVNGQRQTQAVLNHRDVVKVGPYDMTVLTQDPGQNTARRSSANSFIRVPDPHSDEVPAPPSVGSPANPFPPAEFQVQQVSVQSLYATRLPVEEVDYAAIGAGLGSFIWTDFLRLSGVGIQQIRALGLEDKPYARYQRLCLNSQIPAWERLRSNSDSCPDNLWGWPSYALREAYRNFAKGNLKLAARVIWQVFGEPTLIETYTPRSGNVFASIDREAQRIGWSKIYRYGRVRSIRKTNDGRYAVGFSSGRGQHAFLVGRYVHLCTGYPVIQFLPDLQEYREKTRDFKSVVNAYEAHNHVYDYLERHGGTVLIRGRGIVASRVIQRIHEARAKNPNISILHLMRSPRPQGNKFGHAQRTVENHFEFQPFNWPKACWGGTLRAQLEQASPSERSNLLTDWGGTTTADRQDWRDLINRGLNQGWYHITFGEVTRVEPGADGHPITYIQEKGLTGNLKLEANFIIDATGLDGKVKANPLLDDLVTHYHLPLNPVGRLAVSNDFELLEMRNQMGRMYAAGAITFGGPYAAVDSFLGLQYSALKSVDGLVQARAPNLTYLNGVSSFLQWLKWVNNRAP